MTTPKLYVRTKDNMVKILDILVFLGSKPLNISLAAHRMNISIIYSHFSQPWTTVPHDCASEMGLGIVDKQIPIRISSRKVKMMNYTELYLTWIGHTLLMLSKQCPLYNAGFLDLFSLKCKPVLSQSSLGYCGWIIPGQMQCSIERSHNQICCALS